ncbi:MAG: DinB family protein [Bacteroidia bacterium]|nr:DinB family protein [Bacteroidia bacterium]
MNLVEVLDITLSKIKDYLKNLDNERYSRPLELFSNSSIGQHTRHVIEFLQCLIEQNPSGIINYEKRQRNKAIETETETAIRIIDFIIDRLNSGELKESLILETQYDHNGPVHAVETTLDRELIYNIEHAIHHMAIIKIGMKVIAPEIGISSDFGVAPSTVRYRNDTEVSH